MNGQNERTFRAGVNVPSTSKRHNFFDGRSAKVVVIAKNDRRPMSALRPAHGEYSLNNNGSVPQDSFVVAVLDECRTFVSTTYASGADGSARSLSNANSSLFLCPLVLQRALLDRAQIPESHEPHRVSPIVLLGTTATHPNTAAIHCRGS